MTQITRTLIAVLAAHLFALVLIVSAQHIEQTDLHAFRTSAARWQASSDPYAIVIDKRPNLNPPIALLTLFAWLPSVSLETAFVLWTGLGVLAVVWTCWRLRLRGVRLWSALVCCGLCVPALHGWQEGQVVWILLPLATEAYLAHTAGRTVRAGLWLGLLVAFRPPLALAALFLPWTLCAVAGVTSAALTALSIALVGWPVFASWLGLARAISWLGDPQNASLWGIASRLSGATTIAAMPAPWLIGIAVVGGLLWLAARRLEGERRWILAWCAGTLMSPLGWVYYLPLTFGPLARLRPMPLGLRLAIVASCVPWLALSVVVGDPARNWIALVVLTAAAVAAGDALTESPRLRDTFRRPGRSAVPSIGTR